MNSGHAEIRQQRRKSDRKLILVAASVVTVTCVIILTVVPVSVPYSAAPPRIISVSFSPDNPGPGDWIYVLATVEGGTTASPPSVSMYWFPCFDGGCYYQQGGMMYPAEKNTYRMGIGSFSNGTEIWIVIVARIGIGAPVFLMNISLQIGYVLRGGASGLRISELRHAPELPTARDTIAMRTNLTSTSNITVASLLFVYTHHSGVSSGVLTMWPQPSGEYVTALKNSFQPFWSGLPYERGTVFFLRVAAKDASGNTAISGIYSFTIA